MDALWTFVRRVLSHVPENIGYDTEDHSSIVQPIELPEPKRCKFELESLGSTATAWRKLAAFWDNLGDVANLKDLESFEGSLHSPLGEIPSYIS
jgi:hypothetical protein